MIVQRKIIRHFVIWFVYVTINHIIRIIEYHGDIKRALISDTIVKYGLAIAMFYISLSVFRNLWHKSKLLVFVIMIVVPIVNGIVRFYLYSRVVPLFESNYAYPYSIMQSSVIGIWWWFQFSLLGYGYYIFEKISATEAKMRNAETMQLLSENKSLLLSREKLQLEHALLKNQINPHLLFNTLNFFHAKALKLSKELATGIAELSAMMRYALTSNKGSGIVPVQAEVDQLHHYINLHQLRYSGSLNIKFSCHVADRQVTIPGLILITLLENAFKHGIFTSGEPPLEIALFCTNEYLTFEMLNKIRPAKSTEPSTGTGLRYIESRLKLIYDKNYTFNFGGQSGYFKTNLRINFVQQETGHW